MAYASHLWDSNYEYALNAKRNFAGKNGWRNTFVLQPKKQAPDSGGA